MVVKLIDEEGLEEWDIVDLVMIDVGISSRVLLCYGILQTGRVTYVVVAVIFHRRISKG